jgi:hypothetical protein
VIIVDVGIFTSVIIIIIIFTSDTISNSRLRAR